MAVNLRDKYYTPDYLVQHTINKAIEIIGKENITDIVEPSAGDGAFIEELKKAFPDIPQHYYDLHPEHPEVKKYDYKKLLLSYKKGRMTIGNPPFGTSSSLWKAFCKKAASNSDYIVYISPANQYNSNYYFKEGVLVYSELLNDVEYRGSETEGGKAQKVRTCLNVYKVYNREEKKDWRDDKIKQIIKHHRIIRGEEVYEKEYDYYLANGSNGSNNCHLINKGEYSICYAIKVLDENYRSKIEEFVKQFHIYDKELKMLKSSIPVIDNTFFTDKLKKFLFPTREERLEQDVLIERDDNNKKEWDYYLGRWGEGPIGKVSKTRKEMTSQPYCIKVLNEDIKQQVETFLYSLRDGYVKEIKSRMSGTPTIALDELKELLLKYLYPTREERLEQDILIEYTQKEKIKQYDFFIETHLRGIGKIMKNWSAFYNPIAIKILNEEKRDLLLSIGGSFRKYIETILISENGLNNGRVTPLMLKDYFLKHLYPTREERLEQDILFKPETPEYYIVDWGDAGKVIKEKTVSCVIPISFTNDEVRNKFEEIKDKIRPIILKHPHITVTDNGNNHLPPDTIGVSVKIHMPELKEVLIELLYPQSDPDFPDYEYSEIKKPVHVERAHHAKPLIPIEYKEEFVRVKPEEKKVKAVSLF
jgi:hypothetical protein